MRFDKYKRRNFLRTVFALFSGSVFAGNREVSARNSRKPVDTTKAPGDLPSTLGSRSPYEKTERYVGRRAPSGVSFTPLEKLSGIITPSDLHFERHHGGVPTIDPAGYKLLIHGMVERPLKFSLEDLKRFPATSRICFIECSGNGFDASRLPDAIPTETTAGQLDGLLSTSEWTGVMLSTLLRETGVQDSAKWLLAEGQDAAVMTRSIPMAKALDDAMIAYAQNGEPLRLEQGYPVRLLLPGWEGNTNVKWLRRIELGVRPFMTREETSKYSDAMPDGRIRMFTFQMGAKSLITSPSYSINMPGTGWNEIRGLAWSGAGKIRKVEISLDGGGNWREAELQTPVLSKSTTRFRLGWEWDGKATVIMSRATDEFGNTQLPYKENEQRRGPRTFYHNNAIRAWKIHEDGRVSFALKALLT